MAVDNVTFQTNNVVGNFNYPPNVPAYKPIMKFLLNCPLKKAFTNCPSVVYQNFLREFWSTVVAYDPFPLTDETKQRPLREFLIKFSVLNEQRPLTLDFNTFCLSTPLDYNNGKYVLSRNYSSTKQVNSIQQLLAYCLITGTEDPSKVTDIELTAHMIDVNNQKDSVSPLPLAAKPKKGKSQTVTPTLPKSQGPEVPRALSKKSKRPKSKRPPTETKRDIQLASTGLPSTLDEGTRKSKPLPESTATHPKDSGGNKQPLDRDITSTTLDEGTTKTTPRPEGSLGDKDSGENIPPADMEPVHPPVADLSGTDVRAFLLSVAESEEDILGTGEEMDEEPQAAGIAETHHQSPPPKADKPQSSHAPSTEASDTDSSQRSSIDDYYDENIAHQDQTNTLVEASISSLDKSSNTISDLYKGLNIVIELLKEIKNVVKDDSVINKKITEATESFTKFSINITDLQSSVNTLQAHALKQDEELAAWAKSSTNMAWNLGFRLSGLERAQNHIQSSMSSLKEDTHSIKNMMTEMYEVFKGQSSGSVTPTLALTHIPANVEGENTTNTATEDPPSHTKGETGEPKRAIPISTIQPTQAQPITTIITHPESSQAVPKRDKGKGIATESDEDLSKRLVPASTIVRLDPDALIPYIINGEVYHLTAKQLQEQIDKEELINKAEEEARLLAISKPEVIRVVQEEAENIGLDPRKITSAKAGEKFKKA
ncbi:hypothetical protein Tco_1019246 [Tanacetum coccineum]|uniref:Uncharacterized protein n=1 Tax=Tanacetum coccineum TaxID=301880 RepID=A0ABQ5FWN6_9ASTR